MIFLEENFSEGGLRGDITVVVSWQSGDDRSAGHRELRPSQMSSANP